MLFKLVLRVKSETPPSAALNRRLLGAVLSSPGVSGLREGCALDEARAAEAALAIARAALVEIKRGDLFTEEELLEQAELKRIGERLAELVRAREAVEGEEGAGARRMSEKLDRAIEAALDEVEELAKKVENTVAELPPGLERRLEQATSRAGEETEQSEELAQSFAEGVGADAPSSAADRVALAEKLRGNDKLRRLAALAGAFRRDALAVRKKRVRRASSELHRVGRGADLSRLLPAELSAYTDRRRRLDFLRRLAERDLSQYELVGADRGGRGPLVVCVDGSGSMSGARELWAKAVSLALLEIARRQNRRAEAIVFSGRETPLTRFSLLEGRASARGGRRLVDLPRVLEFATCFPGGGTDFEAPLAAAMELLTEADLKGGDVVFITDGEASLTEEFVARFGEERRRRDFGVYAVLVDDAPAGRAGPRAPRVEMERAARELEKVADRITTVSRLTSGSVRELFERL